jgi:hypothetical protein
MMQSPEFTANHYVALPHIDPDDGGVAALSTLHAGMGGVVAWVGDPLLRVSCATAGESPRPLTGLRWDRLDRWIPHARTSIGTDVDLDLTICAPGGYDPVARGAFVACELTNRGSRRAEVDVLLDVQVRGATLQVAQPRPLHGVHRATGGAMHRGIAFEIGAPAPDAALGVACDDPSATYRLLSGDEWIEPDAATDVTCGTGESLRAQVRLRIAVRPGRSMRRAFFLGIGRDRDSALGHAAHLVTVGAGELLQAARIELAHLARRTSDVKLSELVNRNLLFNHYFGLARAFDDDRLYALSSRSPQHVPGAAFNEREALFWTLPCITLTDPLLAREILRDAFELYSAQPGTLWRYLDGGVIEPGFCLEQALLYPLALDRYVREAEDDSILDDPLIQDVLREIDGALDAHLHADVLLCDTETLPGGEPADNPFPTLGNVLLWAYAQALPRIWRPEDGEPPSSFDGAGDDISAAIWQRCMADLNGNQLFVSTTDLARRSAVYDDPVFSLAWIPYFGFCPVNDVTLRDTLAVLRSSDNPFWCDGSVPGLASRVRPKTPSLAALCADLLGPNRTAALQTLAKLRLTDGIASDTYDSTTGETVHGPHAAALAGLLAWSVLLALETPVKPKRKQKS